jgi:hypothetical protein
MGKNNHGSNAQIGDLVEVLNPMGQLTGITGLVYKLVEDLGFGDFDDSHLHRRYFMITGTPHRIKDSLVVVRSFAN